LNSHAISGIKPKSDKKQAQSTCSAQRSHRALSTAKRFAANRIILVTGASDGIGREAALTYSRYGHTSSWWANEENCATWRKK
jgi:hypothetical protein